MNKTCERIQVEKRYACGCRTTVGLLLSDEEAWQIVGKDGIIRSPDRCPIHSQLTPRQAFARYERELREGKG